MAFIYADSCIFIYLLEGSAERKAVIKDIFAPKDFPSNRIAYSDLTKLECLVQPMRDENHVLCSKYEMLFDRNELCYIPITRKIFEQATILRAKFQIKTPDALHLSAAKIAECDVFLTNDKRLQNIDVGVDIEVLG